MIRIHKKCHKVNLGIINKSAKYLRGQSKNVLALSNSKQYVKNCNTGIKGNLAYFSPYSMWSLSYSTKQSQFFQAEILHLFLLLISISMTHLSCHLMLACSICFSLSLSPSESLMTFISC